MSMFGRKQTQCAKNAGEDSMFNGLGCYTSRVSELLSQPTKLDAMQVTRAYSPRWSSGVTLTGVFENNVCSKAERSTFD